MIVKYLCAFVSQIFPIPIDFHYNVSGKRVIKFVATLKMNDVFFFKKFEKLCCDKLNEFFDFCFKISRK